MYRYTSLIEKPVPGFVPGPPIDMGGVHWPAHIHHSERVSAKSLGSLGDSSAFAKPLNDDNPLARHSEGISPKSLSTPWHSSFFSRLIDDAVQAIRDISQRLSTILARHCAGRNLTMQVLSIFSISTPRTHPRIYSGASSLAHPHDEASSDAVRNSAFFLSRLSISSFILAVIGFCISIARGCRNKCGNLFQRERAVFATGAWLRLQWVMLLLLFSSMTNAQNITKLEYFIDIDPGHGNGFDVPITPAPSLTDFTFSVPVTGITEGFHTLSLRTQDANGTWGMTHQTSIYKVPASLSAGLPDVTKLEYFIDTDPGHGNGFDVPITPATSLTDFTFSVPVTGITEGFHTLSLRTQDANGTWGMTHQTSIYKVPTSVASSLPDVVYLEYFLDTDPGYQLGIPIPITSATNVDDVPLVLDVSGLSETTHVLYIRAKDANGVWSMVENASFDVCNGEVPVVATATGITSSGFTANWNVVSGASSYLLDVSTDNFATTISGYNAKQVFINTETISGLSQGTTYQYRVRSVITCNSLYSAIETAALPVATPTAQPSNLQFLNPTESSFQVTFSAASGSPTGYIALRREAASPTANPVDNVTYTVGDIIGDAEVAFVGSGLGFVETGLTSDTEYFYDLFSFNSIGSLVTYRTVSPLEGNFFTVAQEPTAQPTNLTFSNVTSVSADLSFDASSPVAESYLILRKVDGAPTFVPQDGVAYATGATAGDVVVAFTGTSTAFTDAPITELTNYHYSIYAFNGAGTRINYLTTNPLLGNTTTAFGEPSAQPTNLVFNNVTSSTIDISFTVSVSSPTGYLVVRQANGAPTFTPALNTVYSIGQDVGGGTFVAAFGSSNTFTGTGLLASTLYFYQVYAYNQSGGFVSYQLTNPLEGSVTTFTQEPADQPSAVTFTEVSSTGWKVSFNAPAVVPDGFLVLRKESVASTSTPVDGQSYIVGQAIGDASVAYVGTSTTFIDTGLNTGTVHHYSVFSFNGSGAATNYLPTLTTDNIANNITIPASPVLGAATLIDQDAFQINWGSSVGATGYRLDVSDDAFTTVLTDWNDVGTSDNSILADNLSPGIIYSYRLRAENSSGTSMNGTLAEQITVPATPVISDITGIDQQGFIFSWPIITGAASYQLDVSRDDFTTLETGYDNLLVTTNSVDVTGLDAGLEYQVRLRSVNTAGESPNSNILSQLLLPATPVALDATGTTTVFFNANWESAVGASEYRVDVSVSADDFNPSLTAYTDVLVAGNTTLPVEGLTPNTLYVYRVRAVNATGTSPNSSTISVNTQEQGTGTVLTLGSLQFNEVFNAGESNVELEIVSGTPPYTVDFFHRSITSADFIQISATEQTSDNFQAKVTSTMLDELGVEFYFEVQDGSGDRKQSNTGYIYQGVSPSGQTLPFSKSGGTLESYELFSIPYDLTDNLIETIFDEMGAYDPALWRLVRYQGGRNVDFGSGINRIELGKAYWFNQKERIEIDFTNGTVANVNQSESFKMRLETGWNQIGNPFLFNLRWSEILEINGNPSTIGELKVYNSETIQLINGDDLITWSGGFVHNDGSPLVIDIPVDIRNTGGRSGRSARVVGSNIDADEWLLPFTVEQDDKIYDLTAIGMHPLASYEKDWYDDIHPPKWGDNLEFYSRHDEFFNPKFAHDIVPGSDAHTWQLSIESASKSTVTMKWDKDALVNKTGTLLLVDNMNSNAINMSETAEYRFSPKSDQQLSILYANEKFDFEKDIVSSPYPNPFSKKINFPVLIADDDTDVKIEIYNAMGNLVSIPIEANYSKGLHYLTWDGESSYGLAAQGIYFTRMEINGRQYVKRIIFRP